MKWGIFFKKVLFGFITGATASVSADTATGNLNGFNNLLQSLLVGGVTAMVAGASNYLKHAD